MLVRSNMLAYSEGLRVLVTPFGKNSVPWLTPAQGRLVNVEINVLFASTGGFTLWPSVDRKLPFREG